MTEAEWLACTDPTAMVDFLTGKGSERKLLLFSAHNWSDEQAADDEWYEEVESLIEKVIAGKSPLAQLICLFGAFNFSASMPTPGWWAAVVAGGRQVHPPQTRREKAKSLHDIFGNPFRPVAFDPHWRTADVMGVARGIYEDRAFDRMPMLADALMDAGCDSEDILSHCRGDGPHVRGCWVVDLCLSKE